MLLEVLFTGLFVFTTFAMAAGWTCSTPLTVDLANLGLSKQNLAKQIAQDDPFCLMVHFPPSVSHTSVRYAHPQSLDPCTLSPGMENFTGWLNTLMKDRIDQGKIVITETVARNQRVYGPLSSLDAYPD